MRQCTVCRSEHREYIDSEILRGTPFRRLAKMLDQRGFQTTSQTLTRHAEKHVEGYKPRSEMSLEEIRNGSFPTAKDQKFDYSPELIAEAVAKTEDFPNEVVGMLRATILSQLETVLVMQEAHRQGKRSNPTDEIKALESLFNIARNITSTRLGSKQPLNVLDFDSVLLPHKRSSELQAFEQQFSEGLTDYEPNEYSHANDDES